MLFGHFQEGFTWKGHPPLKWATGEVKCGVWRPASLLQVSPPASVNSIGFSTQWGLMAVGTAHGLVIFDTLQGICVTAKCTLNAQGTIRWTPQLNTNGFKRSSFKRNHEF